MGLVLAGVDEAGYGPLLGPLCVGLTALRIPHAETPAEDVNLWRVLRPGVCAGPDDRRGRIAVADSKDLKLANNSKTRHPLAWLERGVLAFAKARGHGPRTDGELFACLGVTEPCHRCYAGEPIGLPLSWNDGQIGIAANVLGRAMSQAEAEVVELSCRAVGEDLFNQTIDRMGSKAHATLGAIRELLGVFLNGPALREDDAVWLVCDRLGGRARYADTLMDLMPGASVAVVFENERESRYHVEVAGREVTVAFTVEGESANLPTALASMTAKLVRELLMMRFNRYWCTLKPELKPTAGYRNDAWRWLDDVDGVLTPEDRRALIRMA